MAALAVMAIAAVAAALLFSPSSAPTPPPDPAPRGSLRTREAPAKATFGWHPRRDASYSFRFGSRSTRTLIEGEQASQDGTAEVEVAATLVVRSVVNQLATLDATVTAMTMRGGELTLDSKINSTPFLSLREQVGKTFVIHLECPSGRVKRVIGITSIRESIISGAISMSRGVLRSLLRFLDDESIRRRLDLLLHVLPPALPTEPRWALERELWLQEELAIAFSSAHSREADDVVWALSERRFIKNSEEFGIPELTFEGRATFEDGVVRRSSAQLKAKLRMRGGLYLEEHSYRCALE